jgi:hypothetical protein
MVKRNAPVKISVVFLGIFFLLPLLLSSSFDGQGLERQTSWFSLKKRIRNGLYLKKTTPLSHLMRVALPEASVPLILFLAEP